MASLSHRTLLWCALGTSGSACTDNAGPSTASFVVVTATAGASTDTDGYTLQIDGNRRESLGTTDTLTVAGLVPGEHQVELQGVASNCVVDAGSIRMVNTTSSDSAIVLYEVGCSGTAGTLQLVTATAGEDLDPSGYVALVSDMRVLPIGPNAVVTTSLPTGTYQVTLDGIAGNCAVDGSSARAVAVLSGGVARLEFAVDCSATAPAGRGHEIAFVRRGREPDGSVLQRLYAMNEDGTSVRLLPTIGGSFLMDPKWLSDGDRLGFLVDDENCFPVSCARPYLLTLASGGPQPVNPVVLARDVSWSPDGARIAFHDVSCFIDCGDEPITFFVVIAPVDGSSETRIVSDSLDYFGPVWLPGGSELLYVRAGEGILDIARNRADGLDESIVGHNLAEEFSGIAELAPSPDGSRVAFSAGRVGQGGTVQIFVMNLDGSDPVAITSGPSNNFAPTWAPDGRHLAIVSDRDGNNEIYALESDGANPIRITSDPASDTEPAWRP